MHIYVKNSVDVPALVLALTEVLHSSFNMGALDLSETYVRSPWAVPSDFGYIFQANHSFPCYNYKRKSLLNV